MARTVLIVSAVLAGAGTVAAEKSGLFDPVASFVDSANHLALNNLHKSYEQLIDKLPEVEKAEAAPPAPEVTYPSSNPGVPNTNCNEGEIIDFTPHSRTVYVNQSTYKAFTVDACLNTDSGLEVRLVEEDGTTDDTLGKITVASLIPDSNGATSMEITFYLDCVDGGWWLPNKIVGSSGYSQEGDASLAIETDYAATFPPEIGNSFDNVGNETGAAQMSCLDVKSGGVGGIAELPEISEPQKNITSEKTTDKTIPIAAGVAAAAAAVTATGAALYIRRNRSVK